MMKAEMPWLIAGGSNAAPISAGGWRVVSNDCLSLVRDVYTAVVELVKLFYVSIAVSSLREGLSAVDAGVGSLSCVDPHVHVELVFADKALVAAGTGVRLVPRVVTLVHLQLCLTPVGAPTLGALELRPHLHVLPTV